MGFFRKNLIDMLTYMEDFKASHNELKLQNMSKMIKQHAGDLDKEFQITRREFREIKQYHDLMVEIHEMIDRLGNDLSPSNGYTLKRDNDMKKFRPRIDEIEEKIRQAHNLIIDVEKLLIKEFGTAHRFLE